MVKFTIEETRAVMGNQRNIRNMSVIAHVDHGKSTLSDALLCKAGIISAKAAGQARATDTRKDEIERGITIKSTGVTMCYKYDIRRDGVQEDYLVNLIDSPGHVDFSSEVTAALRVTDGALVVVDAVEGVCVQTGTVLRQAMAEKIKPVLMLNKVDRAINELKLDGEGMYRNFLKVVDEVNVILSNYHDEDMGDISLDPSKGNVAFGSGKEQWAFTITKFAYFYAKKFNTSYDKLMNRLWGDNYFNPETSKWQTDSQSGSGKTLKRAFVQFIMEPICSLCTAIMEGNRENLVKMLKTIQIEVTPQEMGLKPKELVKTVMSRWLNAADTLLELMILHLPSPVVAQRYRTSYLYEGPQDDACAEAMRNCDPKGPLMIYISKMVPSNDKGRFYAFGRVFSGTATPGEKVRIMGPSYQPGSKTDLFQQNIQRTAVMIGKNIECAPDVPCGNTVVLVGVDQSLMKTGTISNYPAAHCIRSMKYSVSPVVRVAVKPKNPADYPKLIEGLKKLSKSDQLVECTIEESGQNIVAGCGELHVEICLNDLENDYAQCPIIRSNPVVTYKETITSIGDTCLVKTSNKLNRLYANAEPISKELQEAIQRGEITQEDDVKTRAKRLCEEFSWEKDDATRIWCFGPEEKGTNMLVDLTKAVPYMNEVKNFLCVPFQSFASRGVLVEEEVKGMRVNLRDAEIHSDPSHRSQILPSSRRLYSACELASDPTLLEPIFVCEITAPMEVMGGVYQCINQRRGMIFEEEQVAGSPLNLVKAYLPVSESFGLTGQLREATQGKAFPQCVFDHWEMIRDMPLDVGSKAEALVKSIRKRKGLKEEIPILAEYMDKL